MQEQDVKTPALSGEVIIKSVVIPEEEVKLNIPVTTPHTILSSSSSSLFLEQVENLSVDDSLVSDNDGSESNSSGAIEMSHG